MYEGQLKSLFASTYVLLIKMQNMLAPLPDVILHRLSVRDFDAATVIITQCSIQLFCSQHETNNINFDVLLTVHISIFISVFNQLHYTASGIITPIGVMIPEAV
jgi:hypothetical protein